RHHRHHDDGRKPEGAVRQTQRRPAGRPPQAAARPSAHSRAALQDAVPPLAAIHQRAAAGDARLRRRHPGRHHGCRRRFHAGAGDDLPARHADRRGGRHLAVPDHLCHRERDDAACGDDADGGCDACAAPADRLGDRCAVRRAPWCPAARRADPRPAGRAGADRRHRAGLRTGLASRRPLFPRNGDAAMKAALLLVILVCGLAVGEAAAQATRNAPRGPAPADAPLITDLSSHLIAITSSFTGTELLLFGAIDEPGDIIVVVRGPVSNAVVRRKGRTLGLWLTERSVSFDGVPGYYAVVSNKPLEEIAPEPLLQRLQIGT